MLLHRQRQADGLAGMGNDGNPGHAVQRHADQVEHLGLPEPDPDTVTAGSYRRRPCRYRH